MHHVQTTSTGSDKKFCKKPIQDKVKVLSVKPSAHPACAAGVFSRNYRSFHGEGDWLGLLKTTDQFISKTRLTDREDVSLICKEYLQWHELQQGDGRGVLAYQEFICDWLCQRVAKLFAVKINAINRSASIKSKVFSTQMAYFKKNIHQVCGLFKCPLSQREVVERIAVYTKSHVVSDGSIRCLTQKIRKDVNRYRFPMDTSTVKLRQFLSVLCQDVLSDKNNKALKQGASLKSVV